MKALRLTQGHLALDDVPAPSARPGEAIIRPSLVGVCSTDIELCKGYMAFEGVLGHEFVGVVESVTEPAERSWVGRRVVGTINCACGACDMCARGWREHCRDRSVLGIFRRDGCFSERFSLPVANLLEVADWVSDEEAVFTEPLAAALEITRQIAIQKQDKITVLGDGRLGLLCALVLARLSAEVQLVGKHEMKLEVASSMGLQAKKLAETARQADRDIVVDCTGSASGLPTALTMVRPRGTIVLKTTVAPQANDRAMDLAPIVIQEVTVVGSRCGPFDAALALLREKTMDVRRLISARRTLADGAEAIAMSKGGNVIKVLMTM